MNTLEIIGIIVGFIATIAFVYVTIKDVFSDFEKKFEDGEYLTLSFMIVIYTIITLCIGFVAFLIWPGIVFIVVLALMLALFKFLKS